MKIRYLSLSDLVKVGMTLDRSVDIIEQSFCEHAAKEVENPPKLPIHPLPDAFINAMPAYLPRKGACGMKWISGFPTNVGKGIPSLASLLILNDPDNGLPLAVMEGAYITALRTVAASAVSAKHLCNPDASTMALVGCGMQGKYHAVAMPKIVPALSVIKISDNYEPSIKSFVETIGPRLPSVKIETCATAEETIRGADLVITATGKLLEPIFKNEWVKQGALVLPVHTLGWDSSTASKMDKLVVDDWAQYRTVGDIYYQPLPPEPYAETGQIVAGQKAGRESHEERIVNFNKGIAIHDIMMASAILTMANEKGLGSEIEINEPDGPLPMLEV
jgi:ornithine cyclodeaminase/alanine dehydrogenase